MCINFNYYLLFILHAFTCTVAYFIYYTLIYKKNKNKKNDLNLLDTASSVAIYVI